VPEVIEHDVSGLLAEPGDADGLARCVVGLLENMEHANWLAEVGYQRAQKQFSQEQMLAAYRRTYNHMIGTRGNRATNGAAHALAPLGTSMEAVSQAQ
jgi:glycosyltransferase involved in cell wall biosynthesis